MVKFNLTHEHLTEEIPGFKELWKVHTDTTNTIESIFKDGSKNSYSQSADAADVYAIAAAQASEMIEKLDSEAFNQVDAAKEKYYDTDLKNTKPFRRLADIQDWASFVAEADSDTAIQLLHENKDARRAVLQYMDLHDSEQAPEVHENFLQSFEALYETETAAAKKMQEILPVLKDSFEQSLQNQFTLESSHTFDQAVEILKARV